MIKQEIINLFNENQGILTLISIAVAILLALLFKDKAKKVFNYIKGNNVSVQGFLNFTKVNNINNNTEDVLEIVVQSINQRDLQNPILRKFVRAKYGKDYEELDKYSMAVFWEDLEKYLEDVKESEEKYEKIKQGTIGKELKTLFSEVDKARSEFNYQKVDQLLAGFEKENSDLIADIAKTYFLRANNFELQVEYKEAKEYYEKAVTLDDQNPFYLNDYAIILYKLGDYNKAIEYYKKALGIYLKTIGENHPVTAISYNNLGAVYGSKGDYNKAIDYYEKALKIRLKTIGENHIDTAMTYNNLGLVYGSKGDYDKAIDYYEKALEIKLKTIDENHSNIANTYNNLGIVYGSKGDYDKAIDYYEKALEIDLKTIGENHPDVASTYNNLGAAYNSKGDYDKAIDYFKKALKIDLKTIGENHPDVAGTYNGLGNVYCLKGDYNKAIECYEKALEIYNKSDLPEDHQNIQAIKNNLEQTIKTKNK
jgi:tetratricopeptide (TPR) repeat protein